MFNLIPGQGLGYSASRELAFGLGPVSVTVIEPPFVHGGSGGGHVFSMIDNEYSHRKQDESDMADLLGIIFNIIE